MPRCKTVKLADGLDFHYESQANFDILQRELFEECSYFRHGLTLPRDACVFDVGANLGGFVRQVHQLAPAATVFAFEPIPATFALLERNVAACPELKARLFNCGLSSAAGTARFTHYPRLSVASSMHPNDSAEFRRNSRGFALEEIRAQGPWLRRLVDVTPAALWWPLLEGLRRYYQRGLSIACRLETLSNMIEQHQVETIDLLKIDVEGAEQAVLAGLKKHDWGRVQQLIVETHGKALEVARIQRQLEGYGFHVAAEPVAGAPHLGLLYARRRAGKASLSRTA